MSNETDLDWLARNVHVWREGKHEVLVRRPRNVDTLIWSSVLSDAGWITKEQWLARRAGLQNKPSWKDAPEWAEWMAQSPCGHWEFFSLAPRHGRWWTSASPWRSQAHNAFNPGELLGDWPDTLEKRPEQTIADICREVAGENRHEEIFEPFTSIEDNQEKEMKQDNGWFERGELPPVGEVCEILGAFGHYQEWFECKIIAEHNGSVFAANERSWMNVRKGERQFRPLRTERDVLIEIIKKTDDTDDRIADAILAAGFKRGAA